MEFLEKDLEEIIYLSDKDKLEKRGLHLPGKVFRQLRIGNYGIADLIEIRKPYYEQDVFHFKGVINIIELKKDKIGVSTFFQALNYLKGIKTYLEGRNKDQLFNYQITLIGRSVDINSSFCFLGDLFSTENFYCNELEHHSSIAVELYKYEYTIDGIYFKEITNYDLINKGF